MFLTLRLTNTGLPSLNWNVNNVFTAYATAINIRTRNEKYKIMLTEVPIQVAVRVRPLVGDEIHLNQDACLYCDPNKPQISIGKDRCFSFDYVFEQATSQTAVYSDCVKALISSFFDGYNCTVFAYGQTGSGKTYTMGTGNCVYLDEEERGIIPRAVSDIFERINELEGRVICKLRVCFIEVYREETTDLLENSTKNLQIRDDEAGNTVVVGACEEPAESMEDVLNLLDAGTAMRHVGSTNMNNVSSRSHCIFTLILDQYQVVETDSSHSGNVLSSRFHFVDLAGSERAHRTGNQGDRFKESVSINTGLLALGNVISALSDNKRKNQHVPYRQSKLTRLLKDSLGGNSRTVMITCLSPALADLDENINSLKYSTRANSIRNKPVVNWDMESSKVSRMESEIQALRGQLQRRISDQSKYGLQRINDLELVNEKHEVEENKYLQSLHEVNTLFQMIEATSTLPPQLVADIKTWRYNWEKHQFDRPVSAPSRASALRRPQNDIVENLRNELRKCKEQLCFMEINNQDVEELRQEVIAFGEENARLRLGMDVAQNNESALTERIFEQQMIIQQLRRSRGSSRQAFLDEKPRVEKLSPMTPQDRVLQNFRVKSEMLMSQIDDMDVVEHDDDISSDEDGDDDVKKEIPAKESKSRQKKFISHIPIPERARADSGNYPLRSRKFKSRPKLPMLNLNRVENDTLAKLETSRETARHEVKNAEMNVREFTNRLKEMENNIQQKEGLIFELERSEQEARATNYTYKEKLTRLEKEYEKSKRELEEAQAKLNQSQKSNNKDTTQKSKLESDYKKKLKNMQKRYDDLKQKETISNRISSFQQNNEKKVKDLEAWMSRMKNQHNELERKLRSEGDKKSKFEQELRKNEIRIKELEHKTDQQQKLLKRKNEEVVAAQRKLRTSDSKSNDHLEKKKQWIDAEIEKILARQKDIDMLEAELRERDRSLKKKEELKTERDQLEVKKTKSSISISKSIMKLSVQMENVDEQIQQLQQKDTFSTDLKKLEKVKEDLTVQKTELENTIQDGGLAPHEQRRLIELGEAIEAVDEAISFKNDLISNKQSCLDEQDIDYQKNIDHLLNDMGELSIDEYKHLLGKLFLKIIELRKSHEEADEHRYHFEVKVSEQERSLHDMQHMLQVVEARHEKQFIDQNSKYEQEIQFLMSQLRMMENEFAARESNILGASEKKVINLEKELYYYKIKSRKYKDHLRDFTTNVSMETNGDLDGGERKTSASYKRTEAGDELRLPPVNNISKPEKQEKRYSLDQQALDEHQRLQEIFESRPLSTSDKARSSKKNKERRRHTEEIYADSIE